MSKVFISYAREDASSAKQIYTDLLKSGIQVWMDEFSLLPGHNWKAEIGIAIRDSDYFLALLSSNSLSKKGYVQKELRSAFEVLEEFPYAKTFIIPVRLDICQPLDPRLADINWVDLFPSYKDGLAKILKVLKPHNNNSGIQDQIDIYFHTKENEISILSAERNAELPRGTTALQKAAESYLSSDRRENSADKQELIHSGKSCVIPLINAIMARIVRESHNTASRQQSYLDKKDDAVFNLLYKFTMSTIVGDLIKTGHDLIAEIGTEAFDVLHSVIIIGKQDNMRLISALVLLDEKEPTLRTAEAVAVAKRKQKQLVGQADILTIGGVETILFWIYDFILYYSRTDANFDNNLLKSLRERGFTVEEALNNTTREAYDLIMSNMQMSDSIDFA